jgi:DMSO/TMAO reductase YedYZ molybdopterin-dependent catalytic subunit
MNGEPLPFLNGFPLRLVVPGHFGTYWVKHLHRVTVLDRPFQGYFMTDTYRMPANACQCVEPGTRPADTIPIGRYRVRSFLTNVADGARVPAGPLPLRGIAFDGGSGIRRVLVSADGGTRWTEARLGENLGRYSFRPFAIALALTPGPHRLMVQAESMAGERQPLSASWNPSGYALNRIETLIVTAE